MVKKQKQPLPKLYRLRQKCIRTKLILMTEPAIENDSRFFYMLDVDQTSGFSYI